MYLQYPLSGTIRIALATMPAMATDVSVSPAAHSDSFIVEGVLSFGLVHQLIFTSSLFFVVGQKCRYPAEDSQHPSKHNSGSCSISSTLRFRGRKYNSSQELRPAKRCRKVKQKCTSRMSCQCRKYPTKSIRLQPCRTQDTLAQRHMILTHHNVSHTNIICSTFRGRSMVREQYNRDHQMMTAVKMSSAMKPHANPKRHRLRSICLSKKHTFPFAFMSRSLPMSLSGKIKVTTAVQIHSMMNSSTRQTSKLTIFVPSDPISRRVFRENKNKMLSNPFSRTSSRKEEVQLLSDRFAHVTWS